MKSAITFGFALILMVPSFGQQLEGGISGIVRYPDGSPSAEAKVTAITECDGMPFRLVQEARTSTDGSFHVPSFRGADCNKVRLYAEKAEELWLKTGPNVFYNGDNGTTPLVESSHFGRPTMSDITLGNRGGLVGFRVWDIATANFIWGALEVKRKPVQGTTYGSMLIATGKDGSPDTLLLPAGEYVISVSQYSCRGSDFFTASPRWESLTVEAGQRLAKDISVDIRRLKPARSYSNPHGKPCEL